MCVTAIGLTVKVVWKSEVNMYVLCFSLHLVDTSFSSDCLVFWTIHRSLNESMQLFRQNLVNI